MRSYIFTAVERESVDLLLKGMIRSSDPKVAYILSRVRSFKDLARDVDLYLKVSSFAEAEAAVST
jgi:hypothetical protein